MKTKYLFLTLVLLAIGGSLFGQTLTPAGSSTGSITVNAANCNTTNACIILHMASSNVGYSVTISGTWTGTLTVEQSGDNQGSWTSATTTTANTLFTSALTPGITDARVRSSAAMTGTAVVTITASGPATLQQITQTGSSSSSPSSTVAIYAQTYTPYAGKIIWTCTWGNNSAVVTCPVGTFSSASVGYVAFSTSLTPGGFLGYNGSILVCPRTTVLSVQSSSQAILAATCNPASTGNNQPFFVGPDETVGLQAFSTAVNNSCATGILPSGYALTHEPLFFNPPTNTCVNSAAAQFGPMLHGQGAGNSQIVIDPNFVWADCVGGAGHECFFGSNGAAAHSSYSVEDMGITGLGVSSYTIAVPTYLTAFYANTYARHLVITGVGANTQNLTCMKLQGDPTSIGPVVQCDGSGAIALENSGGTLGAPNVVFGESYFGDSNGATSGGNAQILVSGGFLETIGTQFGPTFALTPVYTVNVTGGSWKSIGDGFIAAIGGSTGSILVGCNGGTSEIDISQAGALGAVGTNSTTALLNASGCKMHLQGTAISAAGTGAKAFNLVAGTTLFDDCGNSFSTTAANIFSGTVFGNCSITGTSLTAGAVVASANWGTSSAVSAPSGATTDVSFTLTNGSAAVGANPTLTYTFPTPYLVRPNYCTIQQTGGTQAQIVNEWSVGTPTTTSVVFTYNGTPTINLTEFIAVSCH